MQLDDLSPNLLNGGMLAAIDIAMQRLLVVRQSTVEVALFLALLGQRARRVGIFEVDLYETLPNLVLVLFVTRLVVGVCQRTERELVFSVRQYAGAQVLHNVPLGTVYEHVRQHYQVGIVDDPPPQGQRAGEIQRDDAVPADLQMVVAEFLNCVLDVLLFGLAQQFVEFVEVGGGVAGQRGARPLLFVEHLFDTIHE